MDKNKITIGEVLSLVDSIKPNTRTEEEKILWLNNIDRMVYEEIIKAHEGFETVEFNGYSADTPQSQELLIPKHYGAEVYRFFIEMQIDLANAEYSKYNTSMQLFDMAYNNYAQAYTREHMPLTTATFKYPYSGGIVNAF